MYCFDDKNYAFSINGGIVFKQKFHTKESYIALLEKYFKEVDVLSCNSNYIYCACRTPKQLSSEKYEYYLEKELNIEYPNNYKHNKHRGLMSALIEKVADRYG